MKKYLFGVASVILIFGVIEYTTKKGEMKYSTGQYQYDETNRLIQTGQTNSLVVADMADAGNWSSGLPTTCFVGTLFLRGITFEEDYLSNTGSDGALTKAEAITAVKNYYNANHSFPATITSGSTVISIKISNCN